MSGHQFFSTDHGNLYIVGGRYAESGLTTTNNVWMYSIRNFEFDLIEKMKYPREDFTNHYDSNTGNSYVIGGSDGNIIAHCE